MSPALQEAIEDRFREVAIQGDSAGVLFYAHRTYPGTLAGRNLHM